MKLLPLILESNGNKLPLDNQHEILQNQWRPIASPAMIPVLHAVLKYSYPLKNDGPDVPFDRFHQEDLRGMALRRLYELSPKNYVEKS
jgi:hypothetical protein